MKIVYTPISTLVAALTPEQHAEILTAAGKDAVLVEARTAERQRAEIVDADVLFGRVTPEIFTRARRLRYYHCLGAGVDSVLSPELVESDDTLTNAKEIPVPPPPSREESRRRSPRGRPPDCPDASASGSTR